MLPLTRAMPELLEADRYPFRHRITTRYADLDPNRHINNVALAAAFEDARARFDHDCGSTRHDPRLRMMIVGNYMDYVGEARYPAPIDMHVGTWEIGRSSWVIASLAVQGGKACAFSRAVLVATLDSRPTPLPDVFRAALDAMRVTLPDRDAG